MLIKIKTNSSFNIRIFSIVIYSISEGNELQKEKKKKRKKRDESEKGRKG